MVCDRPNKDAISPSKKQNKKKPCCLVRVNMHTEFLVCVLESHTSSTTVCSNECSAIVHQCFLNGLFVSLALLSSLLPFSIPFCCCNVFSVLNITGCAHCKTVMLQRLCTVAVQKMMDIIGNGDYFFLFVFKMSMKSSKSKADLLM